jgi:hypothetical protein
MSTFTPGGVTDDGGTTDDPAAADRPSPLASSTAPPAPEAPRSVADILRSGGLPSVEQLKAELERQGLPDAVPLVIEAAVKRPPVVSNPARIIPPRSNRVLFAPLSSDVGSRPAPAPALGPTEPTPDEASERPTDPVASPVAEPLAEAVADPAGAPLAAPVAETSADAVAETSASPGAETSADAVAETLAPTPPDGTPVVLATPSAPSLDPPVAPVGEGFPSPSLPEPAPLVASPTPEPAPAPMVPPTPEAAPAVAARPEPTPVLAAAPDVAPTPVLAAAPDVATSPVLAPQAPRAPRPTPSRSPVVERAEPAKKAAAAPGRRRRRGGGAKALLTLVVLGGMVAGAIFAVQRFVLAKAWPAELKEVASFVEAETGLRYDHSVPVREVPAAEFAVRAAAVRLGVPDDGGQVGAADRAMGLFEGDYDPLSGARAAAAVWPALYDPQADAVYVDAGLASGGQRDAYVARELTMALYDQRFGWSRAMATLGTSQALAYRAALEGEATVVATAWLARSLGGDPAAARASEQLTAAEPGDGVWEQLPGSLGLAARVPTALGPVAAVERPAPAPGAAPAQPGVFDVGLYGWPSGSVSTAPVPSLASGEQPAGAGVVGPRGTMGPGYWFSVLASRLDPSVAWMVAGSWAGDQTVTVLRGEQVCVRASVAASEGSLDAWRLALTEWAALGPLESAAEVVAADDHIELVSCDPGPGADTRADLDVVGGLVVFAADQWATATPMPAEPPATDADG